VPVVRKLAATLAADVVGYGLLMGADEEGTLTRLRAHRRSLVDRKLSEYRGRIVKTTGDGMLVEFASVVPSTSSAAWQRKMSIYRLTNGSTFGLASISVTSL
jgi:class 3 adenylate cyclase